LWTGRPARPRGLFSIFENFQKSLRSCDDIGPLLDPGSREKVNLLILLASPREGPKSNNSAHLQWKTFYRSPLIPNGFSAQWKICSGVPMANAIIRCIVFPMSTANNLPGNCRSIMILHQCGSGGTSADASPTHLYVKNATPYIRTANAVHASAQLLVEFIDCVLNRSNRVFCDWYVVLCMLGRQPDHVVVKLLTAQHQQLVFKVLDSLIALHHHRYCFDIEKAELVGQLGEKLYRLC
jgi:hypothetical protein